jgi:hypothetical protein
MPVIKARVILLLGEMDEIEDEIPFGLELSDSGYLANCMYMRREGKLPFTCVIHSRSVAVSVIAHEAVHAANYILDGMGMQADFDNDEVQAYIVQHICERHEIKVGTYE